MPNNPVQIILNDGDFHQAPEPGQPPRPKDFFEGRDDEFAQHKEKLLSSVDAIINEVAAGPYGPAAYLKIQMRSGAVAKSYRPVGRLFRSDQFPCVGAEAVGTLYFRAPLHYLPALRKRIEAAEIQVKTNTKADGKTYKAPTIGRAEVGAIETIEIAPPEGKRSFTTAAALAAFADPQTVSGYHVELFETPEDHVIARDTLGRNALQRSLAKILLAFGPGARSYVVESIGRTPVIELQLTRSEQPALIDNRAGPAGNDNPSSLPPAPIDTNPERHDAVLAALQAHPLVRAILAPLRLQVTDDTAATITPAGEPFALPAPADGATYPMVGVIDTGVGGVLDDWVIGRFDLLKSDEINPQHGTEVAGLIAVGSAINDPSVTLETTGCRIYDAALYPKGRFFDKYRRGFTDFLEELEQAVSEAKEKHGVRIFNLSINAISDVEKHRYSIYASRLDQIADEYGVIFVNSVGNLPRAEVRAKWQKKPTQVVSYFASRQAPDTIQKPSESVRSIAVGALNPPGTDHLEGAPTTYTMRGPGLQVGVKPDVAAYGGAAAASSGLRSIGIDGTPRDVLGTSYAAPLVARALAGLDVATEGGLAPETLRAMLVHNAKLPEPLTKRGLKDIGRSFVGFGKPVSVTEMLVTDDHQITLLFQSRLSIGARKPVLLRFPFTWPQSLVIDESCFGRARMTLVYAPPLDPAFGAEFARVNLEAALTQLQPEPNPKGKPRYLNQITARYMPKKASRAIPEKALIDHGLKWWPVKQYEDTFFENGSSSSWRLEVTSTVRAEATFPAEGVPFAVLLTLEDPEGKRPVFQEMRQQIQMSRANAVDVRTAVRVRQRGS